MNKYIAIFYIILFQVFNYPVQSQSFFDDFESYETGEYLAENSSEWTTWNGIEGGETDVRITDAQAYSGTKSIFFQSDDPNGGPQDVVLPFGGFKYSGLLDFQMMVYIPDDGSGYFNFQGDPELGRVWSMNCFILNSGQVNIGRDGVTHLSSTYSKEVWFPIRVRADLDRNYWSVYIDGNCLGTFSNEANQVSHLDLFPLDSNAFYVDDVQYTYQSVAPPIPHDVSLSNVDWLHSKFVGTEGHVELAIQNNTDSIIQSAVIAYTYKNNLYRDTLSGLNLRNGEVYEFQSQHQIVLEEGPVSIVARIMSNNGQIGDDFVCNDKGSLKFNTVTPAPNKFILVEEGTSTQCNWCPRGDVYMDRMTERYPDHFIPVAIHRNDPMSASDYYNSSILNFPEFELFPNIIVNRQGVFDPIDIEQPFLEEVVDTPAVVLTHGAEFNRFSHELNISVTAEFLEDVSGDYRILAVITEDSVTGTDFGYSQKNGYSGGFTTMGGYENLPDPVPASDMVYNNVARFLLGGFTGNSEGLPDDFAAGSKEVVNFSVTILGDFDMDNLNIVSVILRPDLSSENSELTTLDAAIKNGYTAVTNPVIEAAVDLYPNPAGDITNLSFDFKETLEVKMEILQLNGKVVESRNYGHLQGKYHFPIPLQGLIPGFYYVRIQTQNGQAVKKLIVTP